MGIAPWLNGIFYPLYKGVESPGCDVKKCKKKKTVQPKPPVEIYLDYDEHRSGGGICADDVGNDYPNHYDEHISFTPRALYWKREALSSWLCETIEVPSGVLLTTTAFLVIVRYASGNTFGRSYGRWAIDGIYAEPMAAADIARKISYDGNSHGNLGRGYTPWKGYFDRFTSADVHPLAIY